MVVPPVNINIGLGGVAIDIGEGVVQKVTVGSTSSSPAAKVAYLPIASFASIPAIRRVCNELSDLMSYHVNERVCDVVPGRRGERV